MNTKHKSKRLNIIFLQIPLLVSVLLALCFLPVMMAASASPRVELAETLNTDVAGLEVSGVLLWPNGDAFTTFGGNAIIQIDFGVIDYVTSCPDGGIPDFIYPFTSVYIVPSGSVTVGSTLNDVSDVPNVVMGASGGLFINEIIGATGPVGSIEPGVYAVVYDECQNGKLDDIDTLFDPALEVIVPVDLPPYAPILSMKAEAADARDHWESAYHRLGQLFVAAELAGRLSPSDQLNRVTTFLSSFAGRFFQTDPKKATLTAILNTASHYGGIAADPPDPNYDQLTPLSPRQVLDAQSDAPLPLALAELGIAAGNEQALAQALLASMERYQGADNANSSEWGLIHARAMRDYATLLISQLSETNNGLTTMSAALTADTTDFDTMSAELETYRLQIAASGFVTEDVQLARNLGLTPDEIDQLAADIVAEGDFSFTETDLLNTLTDLQNNNADLITELGILISDTQSIIDSLENNSLVVDLTPVINAGGPYLGVEGASVTFNGSGSGGSIALYEWDLDGDGDFNDGTGIAPTFVYTQAFQGWVGLRATSDIGKQNIGYAPITIGADNSPPVIDAFGPDPRSVELTIGASQVFTVTASDPDGDPVTISWFVDGVFTASGVAFTYIPTDTGVYAIEAAIADNSPLGGLVSLDWIAYVQAVDGDGDGWSAVPDCDDSNPNIHPGQPEILFNGIDDDCDATTPDIGTPAVVDAGVDMTAVEGDTINLAPATFTDTNPANIHTAEIDWGDGTIITGTVNEGGGAGTVSAAHVYGDNGTFNVEVCLTDDEGAVGCDSLQATISNAAPVVDFIDLHRWTAESYPPVPGFPAGDWIVAADGDSVFQSQNGQPTFFYSDFEVANIEVEGHIQVDANSDDDFIGFAFGFQPDDTLNPNAEYLLVDWKKASQTSSSIGCTTAHAPAGLAVSRVFGIPDAAEFWAHDNFDVPDCTDLTHGLEELDRAINLGNVGWQRYTDYKFTFQYSPTHLRVFVDDVLELDVSGAFPAGRLAFFNFSQGEVGYSAFELTELNADEGAPAQLTHTFADAGMLDTHTAVVDWGDGSAADNGTIGLLNGSNVVTSTHRYADNGDYTAQICVTDDDDETDCNDIPVTIFNVPPVVNAGVDQSINTSLSLAPAEFNDLGMMDTHTATVSWGDGITVSGVVTEYLGSGIISATHIYTQSGVFDVAVCVTDNDGAAGCDVMTVTTTTEIEAPFVTVWHQNTVDEGDTITHTLTFSQSNAAYSHTGTVDWGDGLGTRPLTITNDSGRFGLAYLSYIYPDDDVYTATFTICNDGQVCASVGALETVVNVPPIVDAGPDQVVSSTVTLSAVVFTDTGVLDTHTAVIDWGDGITETGLVTETGGAGIVVGTHTYAQAGVYIVEVCVTDDESGRGCSYLSVTRTSDIDPLRYLFLPVITN
ncbi:MAG: hypothetical protein GY796_02575 [Chloroflexi bacterium]|nr:hypothetical protein [Chloroflexota bacterium]